MSKKQPLRFLIAVLLSALFWILFAIVYSKVPSITTAVLHPTTPKPLWVDWIHQLYPRLQTEQWRFDEAFFITKGQQVFLRIAFTIQVILTYLVLFPLLTPYTQKISRLFDVALNNRYIPYMTALLYTNLLLVVYNAISEFQTLAYFSAFYTPAGIGKWLLPVFPSTLLLWLLYAILLGSFIAVVLLPKKYLSASAAALAFLYYQLILFGFGKYDHGFSTLTYALLVYPFFLWEYEKNKPLETTPAWSIVLIQSLICLAYFYCGIEKLFISGTDWFWSNNLQSHLLMHPSKAGLLLAQYGGLCRLLSFAVIVWQCSFILLPFYQKMKYVLLPVGFLFHTFTWLLLDAGGWFNPWWGVYLFFLFPLRLQETK